MASPLASPLQTPTGGSAPSNFGLASTGASPSFCPPRSCSAAESSATVHSGGSAAVHTAVHTGGSIHTAIHTGGSGGAGALHSAVHATAGYQLQVVEKLDALFEGRTLRSFSAMGEVRLAPGGIQASRAPASFALTLTNGDNIRGLQQNGEEN